MSVSFEQKVQTTTIPASTSLFPQKLFDQKFEIAILFNTVEKFQNYTFKFSMTHGGLEDRSWDESMLRIIC